MKKYEAYLKEVGISTKVALGKVSSLYNICSGFLTEEIISIFVSEYRNTDGSPVYESLFLLTDQNLIEIKRPFDEEFNWDCIPLTKAIDCMELSSTNYDYKTTDDSSRLSVKTYAIGGNWYNQFKASGTNCNHLWSIVNEHLKPNIVRIIQETIT